MKFPESKALHRALLLIAVIAVLIVPGRMFFANFKQLMPHLPPCPTFWLLKLYCPGCGSVRAIYSLFHWNIRGIFANNLMLPVSLLLAAVVFIDPGWNRHYRIINCYIAVLIVFTVLRNLPWYPFSLLAPAGI